MPVSVSSVHRAAWPRYFPDSANTMETAGRDAAGGRDLFRGRVRKTRLEERDEGGITGSRGPREETTWTIFTFYTLRPRGMKTAPKKAEICMQACPPECGQKRLIKTDLFYATLSLDKSEKILIK